MFDLCPQAVLQLLAAASPSHHAVGDHDSMPLIKHSRSHRRYRTAGTQSAYSDSNSTGSSIDVPELRKHQHGNRRVNRSRSASRRSASKSHSVSVARHGTHTHRHQSHQPTMHSDTNVSDSDSCVHRQPVSYAHHARSRSSRSRAARDSLSDTTEPSSTHLKHQRTRHKKTTASQQQPLRPSDKDPSPLPPTVIHVWPAPAQQAAASIDTAEHGKPVTMMPQHSHLMHSSRPVYVTPPFEARHGGGLTQPGPGLPPVAQSLMQQAPQPHAPMLSPRSTVYSGYRYYDASPSSNRVPSFPVYLRGGLPTADSRVAYY